MVSSMHVYRQFEDFKVLDDLGIRFIVVDWEEGRKSFMWGSQALLEAFNMTQQELNAWNFKDQVGLCLICSRVRSTPFTSSRSLCPRPNSRRPPSFLLPQFFVFQAFY